MSIYEKIKGVLTPKKEESGQTDFPTLEQIREKIAKAKLNFGLAIADAESASKKSQSIYSKLWDSPPDERAKLRRQKADYDATVKRKMVQAQGFAKSQGVLQDVEIVMQIDQAFTQCGLVDGKTEKSKSLEDMQKSLEEASLVVAKTMEAVERLGMSVSPPDAGIAPASEYDRELDGLWAAFDRERDPAKKEEIKRKLQEKEATPQMALSIGGL